MGVFYIKSKNQYIWSIHELLGELDKKKWSLINEYWKGAGYYEQQKYGDKFLINFILSEDRIYQVDDKFDVPDILNSRTIKEELKEDK